MQTWLDVCERGLTVAASVATFGMMLLTTADAGALIIVFPQIVLWLPNTMR